MVSKVHAKQGRPPKRRKQFPPSKKRPLDTEWEAENTCFGSVRKNKDGEILITREMYEDMEMQLNALSESMYKQHYTVYNHNTALYYYT